MKKIGIEYKGLVVDLLCKSFKDNLSVNFIVNKSGDKAKRLQHLMDYSFEVCNTFGDVFLSDDDKACALVLYPEQKRFTFKSLLLDIKLILQVVGISNIFNVTNREKAIKSNYPDAPFYYLWFIGVSMEDQGKGIGSNLLSEIIKDADQKGKPVYLETSTVKNIAWYQKFGFSIYNKLEFGYTLFLFKRIIS
ncbi:N-acetyltransferase [Pedobacter sp. KBW06]|uniref:GNAT family N-acetyltransferase n=1 Tax=Pedobacter sp. KBW06 TaxID=2153359 RepID=UPI000F5A9DFF|nr:GNAT family N-acetyltransferase [Pedobacter sp. KBW06]RQO74349.1 N-acetyltransferase [Pedobacter sp. KBW06]